MAPEKPRSLAREFAQEAGRRLGTKARAVWLSGSLARGDFVPGSSDVDLELIVAKGEKKRTTDDMEELRELTRLFRERAMEQGAKEFHCFVARLDDLLKWRSSSRAFHILDTALHAETLYGKSPRDLLDVDLMERRSPELALRLIKESRRFAEKALSGESPFGIDPSFNVVMETDHTPVPMWEALSVAKASNFVVGKGEWTKRYIQTFAQTFPEYATFVRELWGYKADQSKLRARGEGYVRNFIQRCLDFMIQMGQLKVKTKDMTHRARSNADRKILGEDRAEEA